MIDPNEAFLCHKAGHAIKDGGIDTTNVIINTFLVPDTPPEMIGIVGMEETHLKHCAMVRGWHTEVTLRAGCKIEERYVKFINGLTYSYVERFMSSSQKSKPEIGVMFVRAQEKEE